MNITIKKSGDLNLDSKFKELKDLIKNGSIKSDLTDIAYDHFMESFPSSNSELGGGQTDSSINGWIKRKDDYNHPPLNKTVKLIKSIKKDNKKGKIYSNLDYASYQNSGSGGWLPKREFIGPSKNLIEKSVKHIVNRISKIFKK